MCISYSSSPVSDSKQGPWSWRQLLNALFSKAYYLALVTLWNDVQVVKPCYQVMSAHYLYKKYLLVVITPQNSKLGQKPTKSSHPVRKTMKESPSLCAESQTVEIILFFLCNRYISLFQGNLTILRKLLLGFLDHKTTNLCCLLEL